MRNNVLCVQRALVLLNWAKGSHLWWTNEYLPFFCSERILDLDDVSVDNNLCLLPMPAALRSRTFEVCRWYFPRKLSWAAVFIGSQILLRQEAQTMCLCKRSCVTSSSLDMFTAFYSLTFLFEKQVRMCHIRLVSKCWLKVVHIVVCKVRMGKFLQATPERTCMWLVFFFRFGGRKSALS